MKGKFIIIEGGDGAGKDTQVDLLKQDFADRNDILFTREPGGTPTAHAIRELILTEFEEPLSYKAELLLFLAARAQLVDSYIRPALDAGKHVICMRFDLSTIAYQLYGRKQEHLLDTFKTMAAFARGDVEPDHYIFLDVDPEIGMERTEKAKGVHRDRIEKEALEFHQRLTEGFKRHVGDYPHTIIDGNRSIEDVHNDMLACIEHQLGV